jgi:hypothetical protein
MYGMLSFQIIDVDAKDRQKEDRLKMPRVAAQVI